MALRRGETDALLPHILDARAVGGAVAQASSRNLAGGHRGREDAGRRHGLFGAGVHHRLNDASHRAPGDGNDEGCFALQHAQAGLPLRNGRRAERQRLPLLPATPRPSAHEAIAKGDALAQRVRS